MGHNKRKHSCSPPWCGIVGMRECWTMGIINCCESSMWTPIAWHCMWWVLPSKLALKHHVCLNEIRYCGPFSHMYYLQQLNLRYWQNMETLNLSLLGHSSTMSTLIAQPSPRLARIALRSQPITCHRYMTASTAAREVPMPSDVPSNWYTHKTLPLSKQNIRHLFQNRIPDIRARKFLSADECQSLVKIIKTQQIVRILWMCPWASKVAYFVIGIL